MADLWGYAGGVQAANELSNANTFSALKAQEMMGAIAQQPADLAYKQAQARMLTAQATEHEAAAKSQQALLDLQTGFAEEEQKARKALIDGAASKGVRATVADLPEGGSIIRASAADQLEKFAAYATQKGYPPMALAKVSAEIAAIREKEAIGGRAAAQQAEANQRVVTMKATAAGNTANAALESESNYNAIMMDPEKRAILPPQLTGNYAADRQVLQAISSASQDAIKKADLARKIADSESQRRLNQSNQGKITATIENLKARTITIKKDLEFAEKAGGKYSPEVVQLRKDQAANQRSLTASRDKNTYKPLPLDAGPADVGTVFRLADGSLGRIFGMRPDGKPRIAAYDNPTGLPPAASLASDIPDAPAYDTEGEDLGDN
jgi:hypothetical protein